MDFNGSSRSFIDLGQFGSLDSFIVIMLILIIPFGVLAKREGRVLKLFLNPKRSDFDIFRMSDEANLPEGVVKSYVNKFIKREWVYGKFLNKNQFKRTDIIDNIAEVDWRQPKSSKPSREPRAKLRQKHDYKNYLSKSSNIPISSSVENTLPNYNIESKIGSGGSATVYKAIDDQGYEVAIKLPKFMDETLDSSVFDKFESEAKMWKNLEHDNIIELYESGLDPLPFIAMGLADGGNLKQLMAKYELSVDDATTIMIQILDGMAYAHRMATVHRDLKPENILFTEDGTAKISDWGIGKFMASEGATKTIGTKGTLLYCAPEQISKKKFGKVDWATDVFQLGTIFYEMVTGDNPFYDEDSAGIMGKILSEDAEPPSRLNSEVPRELDDIIMKALEKRKEDRWSSAEVMYHELKRVVDE